MAKIKHEIDLEFWLVARSEKMQGAEAAALGIRAAMRVLGLVGQSVQDKQRPDLLKSMLWTLPAAGLARTWPSSAAARSSIRAALIASQVISGATRSAIVSNAVDDAARLADSIARSCARAADLAAGSSFAADDVDAASRTAAEAARSASAAVDVVASTAARAAAWAEVEEDANFLEEGGPIEELLSRGLFSVGKLYQLLEPAIREFNIALRQHVEGEPVWIAWYEKLLRGHRFSEAEASAYVFLEGADWEKSSLSEINAAIRKKLESLGLQKAEDASEAPSAPDVANEATQFGVTTEGIEIVSSPATPAEQQDAELKSLHAAILRRLKRIDPGIPSLDNTQRELKDEYNDFAAFISNDFADLDIPTIWSCGAGLTEMVGRIERQHKEAVLSNSAARLAELPSEAMISQLVSLTRDYAAFIMGFDQAQKLALRAAELANLDISKKDQARQVKGILAALLKARKLLAKKASQLFGSLDRAIEVSDDATTALIGAGTRTTRNAVISVGKMIQNHPAILVPVALLGSPVDVAMKLSGDPNWETLRAGVTFLAENSDVLYAFANHDPVMRRWLEWLVEQARGVEIRPE